MGASDRNPQYYCPLRDRYVNISEADILVVSMDAKEEYSRPEDAVAEANIALKRAHDDSEQGDVMEICNYFWDETEFHCFDQVFSIDNCHNVLAYAEGEVVGLLSYKKIGDVLYLVVINVYPEYQGQGIARRLIREAVDQARKQGCKVVKVATTNDDIPALCVYQKMGFRMKEVVPGLVAQHHGEELNGFAGIKVLDELRLEMELN